MRFCQHIYIEIVRVWHIERAVYKTTKKNNEKISLFFFFFYILWRCRYISTKYNSVYKLISHLNFRDRLRLVRVLRNCLKGNCPYNYREDR